MRKRAIAIGVAAGLAAMTVGGIAVANGGLSFGEVRDRQLSDTSNRFFGVGTPIKESSSKQLTKGQANADPTRLVTLAKGLSAHVVAFGGGFEPDQISLWPNATNPTHLIACNGSDPSDVGLELIELATGKVTNIVTGTDSCDPTRLTPWGTIVFGEEAGGGPNGGRIYELIDPLETENVTLDRTTGVFSGGKGANNLVARTAIGRAPSRASASWTTARRTSTSTILTSARRTGVRATST